MDLKIGHLVSLFPRGRQTNTSGKKKKKKKEEHARVGRGATCAEIVAFFLLNMLISDVLFAVAYKLPKMANINLEGCLNGYVSDQS